MSPNPTLTTTYTYNGIDTTKWLVSRLTATTKKSEDGNGNTACRQSSCTYFVGSTLPDYCWIEPPTTPPGAPDASGTDPSVRSSTTYVYSPNGQPTYMLTFASAASSNDPQSSYTRKTQILYDSVDGVYPVSVAHPGTALTTTYAYHGGLGVLAQSADENNNITTYTYDGFGRPTTVTPPVGGATTVSYEIPQSSWPSGVKAPAQFAIHSTTAGGEESYELVNYNGRVFATRNKLSDGTFSSVLQNYTSVPGQVLQTSLPFRDGDTVQYTTYAYDNLGRVKTVTLPDTNVLQYSYSPGVYAMSVAFTDANGNVHNSDVDAAGRTLDTYRLISFGFPPSYHLTAFGYGPFDVVTQINPQPLENTSAGTPRSASVYLYYDTLGRRTWIQDGDLGKRMQSYNALGELVSEIDPTGAIIKYKRDALGRVTKITNSGSATLTRNFTWDTATNGVGRLANTSSDIGRHDYTYFPGGLVASDTLTVSQIHYPASAPPGNNQFVMAVKYGYDSFARLNEIDYPTIANGNQFLNESLYLSTFYDFDGIGQVKHAKGGWCTSTTICTPSSSNITYWGVGDAVGYTADNLPLDEEFGSGPDNVFQSTFLYDPARRWVTSVAHTSPGFGSMSIGYGNYDANGGASENLCFLTSSCRAS